MVIILLRNRELRFWLKIQLILMLLMPAISAVGTEKVRAEEEFREEGFTIVVIPDTQNYSEFFPDIYTAQTEWIVDNRETLNIVFAAHEGDIVNTPDSVTEWENANSSMSILDGIVPYGVLPGNHDQPAEYYNTYFGYTRYESESWYAGHYGDTNDNNFQLFSVGGMDFVLINLEYDPSESVLNWANAVMGTHNNKRVILNTHTILDINGTRNDIGERIFDSLKGNNNLFLMLCGHVPGEATRTDNVNGNTIYQLRANYQNRTWNDEGGGWLRVMRFYPDKDLIHVETYSPYLDKYETDEDSQFVLYYDMEPLADFELEPVPDTASEPLIDNVTKPAPDIASEFETNSELKPAPDTASESLVDSAPEPVPDIASESLIDEVTKPVTATLSSIYGWISIPCFVGFFIFGLVILFRLPYR